ncbi:MAG: DUF58 domain-containing protein [Bdellovibrionaceae bacterium]|nr:DUF58 domain-containing protein [Pseudobdellovibrionaceae bacterium]
MNKELMNKVKQIDIRLRRKVNSIFSGAYHSAFKGEGMVFSDVREYVFGDDVRSISWNLTAKMSKPYIKTFEEDKQAQIILAVDISSSMDFGAGSLSKKSVTDSLASLIAFCSLKNKDTLGLLLFSSDIELYIPPKKGNTHSFRVIREICGFKKKSSETNINKALSFLYKVLKRKSHIFILSDFLGAISFEKSLKQLEKKHEIVSLIISDPFEHDIPDLGLVDVEDMETGQLKTIDFSSYFLKNKLKQSLKEKRELRNKQFVNSKSDKIIIDCEKDIYQPLINFFRKRA